MFPQSDLLSLPVYSKSRKQYYSKADKDYAKIEKIWENNYAKVNVALSEEKKIWIQTTSYAPPWDFNDIIGFVKIGYDLGTYITGDIFLKIKNIPKTNNYIKNLYVFKGTTTEKNQIYHYTEIPKAPIGTYSMDDNKAIRKAISDIITNAEKMVKKINKKWNLYKMPIPFDCIDFAKTIKRLRKLQRHIPNPCLSKN